MSQTNKPDSSPGAAPERWWASVDATRRRVTNVTEGSPPPKPQAPLRKIIRQRQAPVAPPQAPIPVSSWLPPVDDPRQTPNSSPPNQPSEISGQDGGSSPIEGSVDNFSADQHSEQETRGVDEAQRENRRLARKDAEEPMNFTLMKLEEIKEQLTTKYAIFHTIAYEKLIYDSIVARNLMETMSRIKLINVELETFENKLRLFQRNQEESLNWEEAEFMNDLEFYKRSNNEAAEGLMNHLRLVDGEIEEEIKRLQSYQEEGIALNHILQSPREDDLGAIILQLQLVKAEFTEMWEKLLIMRGELEDGFKTAFARINQVPTP